MNLVIDIGNTNIVVAIKQHSNWLHHWRIPTNIDTIASEYEIRLRQQFLESDLKISAISKVAISSVVPELTDRIIKICQKLFVITPFVITPNIISKLTLGNIIKPNEIGSDLVANAVGAYERFSSACIIIDFGTALTFTSVDDSGHIVGVKIAPGVKTAMKSLSSNTAKLPEIPLEIPNKFIGTNTVEAMQAGIMQGYVGLVKYMVNETKKELNTDAKIVATGGLSFIFKPLHDTIDEILPNLTLDGILEVFRTVK